MCTPDNFKLTDTPTPSTSLSDKRHKSFPFLNRLDLRATWTNAKQNLTVAGYVNNVLDDVAALQVLRNSKASISVSLPAPPYLARMVLKLP